MISLASWWWPKRPLRVPGARTAVFLAGLGAALFGVSALVLKTGAVSWDVRLFRILNQVPAAAASVLATGALLRRAGRASNSHDAATDVQAPRAGPEPHCGSTEGPEPR